jgi:nucleotidyltransferase/DNA polymerase involved in DNA repair
MAEWLKAAVLKTAFRSSGTGVRIPLPPPPNSRIKEAAMAKTAGSRNKLTDLPNIGKTTAAKLERIGLKTPDEFLKRDPYNVFHELRKKVDPTLCRCALAGIVGAKTGKPWHKITKKTAAEYEKRHPRHKWGLC